MLSAILLELGADADGGKDAKSIRFVERSGAHVMAGIRHRLSVADVLDVNVGDERPGLKQTAAVNPSIF